MKIQKQAQRCLGRELEMVEKMLEGCLYPKINFWRMLTKVSESGSKYAQIYLLEFLAELQQTQLEKTGNIHKKVHRKKQTISIENELLYFSQARRNAQHMLKFPHYLILDMLISAMLIKNINRLKDLNPMIEP